MRNLIVLGAALVLSSTVYVTRGVAGPTQSSPPATAQEPHDHNHPATAPPAAPAQGRGMRGEMMAKKPGTDDGLNRLVTAMNAATGEAKVAAIADLLTRLVQQQAAANQSMAAMHASCSMMQAATGEATPEH